MSQSQVENLKLKPTITLEEFEELKSQLRQTGRMTFRVVTGSMAPLIPVDADIEIRPMGDNEPLSNDIVVFLNRNQLICHCVWRKNVLKSVEGFTTYVTRSLRGHEDLPVNENLILGIVESHKMTTLSKVKITLSAWKVRFLRKK